MTLTRERYDEICQEVDKEVKANNGHTFVYALKTRCQYCGRSPRARGKCRAWFMTWVNTLYNHLTQEPI